VESAPGAVNEAARPLDTQENGAISALPPVLAAYGRIRFNSRLFED